MLSPLCPQMDGLPQLQGEPLHSLAFTSLTHPLQVAFVDIELPGRVGLTFAPGKTDPSGVTGDWARDLDLDLARLSQHHGVDVLVTLLDDGSCGIDEFDQLRITDLGACARAHGMAWLVHPIRDGGVPQHAAQFADLIEVVVEYLTQGLTVVGHCRGGLGRAGVLASCVLVSLGRTVPDAIAAVRVVRPGAVENQQQERFVAEFAARSASSERPIHLSGDPS